MNIESMVINIAKLLNGYVFHTPSTIEKGMSATFVSHEIKQFFGFDEVSTIGLVNRFLVCIGSEFSCESLSRRDNKEYKEVA